MLELLFSTGLRVSELCALSKDTFLLNDSGLRLLVKGKGRKERILQITTPELLQVVQTYCDMFSKEIQEQGAILFNQRGRPLSTCSGMTRGSCCGEWMRIWSLSKGFSSNFPHISIS